MSVDSSKLPREVVRTVVAVSGHKEDNFRRVRLVRGTGTSLTRARIAVVRSGHAHSCMCCRWFTLRTALSQARMHSLCFVLQTLDCTFCGQQVCLDTLRELAVADPRMVAHANGFRVLLAAASDPATQVAFVFLDVQYHTPTSAQGRRRDGNPEYRPSIDFSSSIVAGGLYEWKA